MPTQKCRSKPQSLHSSGGTIPNYYFPPTCTCYGGGRRKGRNDQVRSSAPSLVPDGLRDGLPPSSIITSPRILFVFLFHFLLTFLFSHILCRNLLLLDTNGPCLTISFDPPFFVQKQRIVQISDSATSCGDNAVRHRLFNCSVILFPLHTF